MTPRPWLLLAGGLALSGCEAKQGEWRLGEKLTDLRFSPYTENVGVYPDTSILDDPDNPFVGVIDPNSDLKWQLHDSGCDRAVYSWATALAIQPTGEHQFYTASCMQQLYEGGRVDDEDLYLVWTLAVRGYEEVLLSFPDSVTYDATGTIAYDLAPIAEAALVSIGAVAGEAPNPTEEEE